MKNACHLGACTIVLCAVGIKTWARSGSCRCSGVWGCAEVMSSDEKLLWVLPAFHVQTGNTGFVYSTSTRSYLFFPFAFHSKWGTHRSAFVHLPRHYVKSTLFLNVTFRQIMRLHHFTVCVTEIVPKEVCGSGLGAPTDLGRYKLSDLFSSLV